MKSDLKVIFLPIGVGQIPYVISVQEFYHRPRLRNYFAILCIWEMENSKDTSQLNSNPDTERRNVARGNKERCGGSTSQTSDTKCENSEPEKLPAFFATRSSNREKESIQRNFKQRK
ncbi:hypothetical protein WR25_00451 [Diploscapter pachys]|uniref:Uncharacterized protein n=1 Tax=Diploscapter pachys TaxID=2018661 RepID=A0A2A2K073_9BILA|nr:hypothetical protein WR25_00451 [Diploscapter pachys]